MLVVYMSHLAKLTMLHRLNHAATLGTTMPRLIHSIQGKQSHLVQQSCHLASLLAQAQQHLFVGTSDEQARPDSSGLAPHLQQEWDHKNNAHLGSIIITPQSHKKAWWRSGMCKTGQPHRWQARVCTRSIGTSCPYDSGSAVCPCNDLAHNFPKVAAEWDWEANGKRTPETVTAGSDIKAAWRCGPCGHRWSTRIWHRHMELDAPSVPMRPDASCQGSPASVLEQHTCWRSGTGKPMRHMAGTQTGLLWAQSSRCIGSCKTSASWAWCTDGRQDQAIMSIQQVAHPSPLAMLCVLATPWLCNAQRQHTFGTFPQMEA